MVNFQKKFPTSVPKALICWEFDWELKSFQGHCNKHQLTDNKKLMLGIVIKLSHLKI